MLEVLDTAGQEEYTALRDQWIRDGEGFILVYSITSRNSYDRIRKFFNQVQRVKESSHPGSPTNHSYLQAQMANTPVYTGPVPVMLVGNKSDKHHEREVSSQEGQALAKELGCEFVEASAKNCVNVEKAFFRCSSTPAEAKTKSNSFIRASATPRTQLETPSRIRWWSTWQAQEKYEMCYLVNVHPLSYENAESGAFRHRKGRITYCC